MSGGIVTGHSALKRNAQIPEIVDYINRILSQGHFNCINIGFTLTANAASTALADPRITPNSFLGFMPTTAHAAAALSGLYVTNLSKGSCIINHANDANADKTFNVAIIG